MSEPSQVLPKVLQDLTNSYIECLNMTCVGERKEFSHYCKSHECKISSCRKEARVILGLCANHACKVQRCQYERVSAGEFCKAHTCGWSNCVKQISYMHMCYEHLCQT